MSIDMEALKKLPLSDKLEIIAALWKDVEAEACASCLTAEQWAEIRRRSAEMEADPNEGISEEEFWERVDGPQR